MKPLLFVLAGATTVRWEAGNADDFSATMHLASGATPTLNVGANNVTFGSSLTFDGGTAVPLAAAGHAVEMPRLPGHGTEVGDLLDKRWEDWAGAAEDALARLAARTERQVVAGRELGRPAVDHQARSEVRLAVERPSSPADAVLDPNRCRHCPDQY